MKLLWLALCLFGMGTLLWFMDPTPGSKNGLDWGFIMVGSLLLGSMVYEGTTVLLRVTIEDIREHHHFGYRDG